MSFLRQPSTSPRPAFYFWHTLCCHGNRSHPGQPSLLTQHWWKTILLRVRRFSESDWWRFWCYNVILTIEMQWIRICHCRCSQNSCPGTECFWTWDEEVKAGGCQGLYWYPVLCHGNTLLYVHWWKWNIPELSLKTTCFVCSKMLMLNQERYKYSKIHVCSQDCKILI